MLLLQGSGREFESLSAYDMKTNLICDECHGTKGEYKTEVVERPGEASTITAFVPCWLCAGTGYSSDEDDLVPIIRWEK